MPSAALAACSEPPKQPFTGSRADDCRDLADGLAKWRRGEHEVTLWEWRLQFTVQWGEHVPGALRALHALAWSHDWGFPGPRRATV
jgi:hypothetical protein